MHIQPGKNHTYLATASAKKERVHYVLTLAKFDGMTLADVVPEVPETLSVSTFPAHTLLKIELRDGGRTLHISFPEEKSMARAIKKSRATVVDIPDGLGTRQLVAKQSVNDLEEIVRRFVASGGEWKENPQFFHK